MFQKTPFFPCGTIPFRTKAIRSKHMRRLVNVSVNYILGGRHISYRITHKFEVLFPCGKTQQVRPMRSRPESHAFCFFCTWRDMTRDGSYFSSTVTNFLNERDQKVYIQPKPSRVSSIQVVKWQICGKRNCSLCCNYGKRKII